MITEPEAEPDDDTPDGVLPLRDALPMIAERAAIASIGRALDDLDEIANDVSDVGRFAIIFAERVRGILMMADEIKLRCGR